MIPWRELGTAGVYLLLMGTLGIALPWLLYLTGALR